MDFIPENPILEFLPDTLVSIRKLYNLDDGRMAQSVDILEQWVKKQLHFRNKNFTKIWQSNFDRENLFEPRYNRPYLVATINQLLCTHYNPMDVAFTLSTLVALPKMTQEHERIYVIKINGKDITSSHILDYYKMNLVAAEYLKAHDFTNGVIAILDKRDANLTGILSSINIIEFQQFVTIVTEGFGARLKGIHLITQSKVVDIFVKTFKNLVSEKLGKRIYVHSDLEDLHRVLNKDILPLELGGQERSIMELQDSWIDILSSAEHEQYLAQMKASTIDESLRRTDKFNEQYMGLPGSFRTLTVD